MTLNATAQDISRVVAGLHNPPRYNVMTRRRTVFSADGADIGFGVLLDFPVEPFDQSLSLHIPSLALLEFRTGANSRWKR